MRSNQLRALALTAAVLAAGLGGCVYDPYYGYAYPDPLLAGAVVGGVVTAAVLTDTDYWPYYGGYYHGYYGGYPRYRHSYGGPWHGRHYSHRPYYHGSRRR
jgi:hypothetical protein